MVRKNKNLKSEEEMRRLRDFLLVVAVAEALVIISMFIYAIVSSMGCAG